MVSEEFIKFVAADAFGCSIENIRIRPKFLSIARIVSGDDNTSEFALSKETREDVLYYIISLDYELMQGRFNVVDAEGGILSVSSTTGVQHYENLLLKKLSFTRSGSTFQVFAQAAYYEITRI